MLEKDKMLAGQWYNANFDDELIGERLFAKELCFDFNNTRPKNLHRQRELLRKLLPNVEAELVEILAPFMVDYGYHVWIGAGSFLNHNIYLMDCAEIRSVRIADFIRRCIPLTLRNAGKVWKWQNP